MGTQLNTAELNKTVKKKEIGLENKKSGNAWIFKEESTLV